VAGASMEKVRTQCLVVIVVVCRVHQFSNAVGIAHCCHATIDGNDYCVASFTNVGIGML
jgi:hypothetical protein